MTLRHSLRLRTLLPLAGALALGACAVNITAPGPKTGNSPLTAQQTLLAQDANGNGILDAAEKPQTVRQCRSEPCDVIVTPAPMVSANRLAGFDCGIRLSDDVLIFGPQVSRLTWVLTEPAGSSNDYRFLPAVPGKVQPFGVFLYADPEQRAFAIGQAQPQRITLVRGVRQQAGFAYGVYLQWKPKGSSDKEWQACNPLDPVIIELN